MTEWFAEGMDSLGQRKDGKRRVWWSIPILVLVVWWVIWKTWRVAFGTGYWRGRVDENEFLNADLTDGYAIALMLRDQIAAAFGEAAARHWVEYHLKLDIDTEEFR